MKYLILGIDGGDANVFMKYDMPFVHSLIKKNSSIKLTEDLHSRGWIEIISGNHARENQGFYLRPKLDGTRDFTLNYSFDDLNNYNDKPLIWDLVLNKKNSVGIMNVPTTYPAPPIDNGWFISGAGGGLTKVRGIPEDMCSSKEIKEILENDKYIVDLRLQPSKLFDIDDFFNKSTLMMKIRIKNFIKLNKKFPVDFSFLVLRAPTNVTYAGMYEIEEKKNPLWKIKLEDYFKALDNSLKDVFQKLNPTNFILTADHGVEPQKFHANYNIFLSKKNYLSFNKSFRLIPYLKRIRGGILNYFPSLPPRPDIDWKNTKVFGYFYYNGLYVNDVERFNGIVTDSKLDMLVDKVCEDFNNYPLAKKYKMSARPYRRYYLDSKFSAYLPDIWIDAPDSIFFMGRTNKFVAKNPWYKELKTLSQAPSSMLTGAKGRHPICIMNQELADLIKMDDKMDLTIIYHIIKRDIEFRIQ